MNSCPCCSQTMLRHVRNNQIYWYCPSCHQEMPNFDTYFFPEYFDKKDNFVRLYQEKQKQLLLAN